MFLITVEIKTYVALHIFVTRPKLNRKSLFDSFARMCLYACFPLAPSKMLSHRNVANHAVHVNNFIRCRNFWLDKSKLSTSRVTYTEWKKRCERKRTTSYEDDNNDDDDTHTALWLPCECESKLIEAKFWSASVTKIISESQGVVGSFYVICFYYVFFYFFFIFILAFCTWAYSFARSYAHKFQFIG